MKIIEDDLYEWNARQKYEHNYNRIFKMSLAYNFICQLCRLELKFHEFDEIIEKYCPVCRQTTKWRHHA